MTDVVSTVLQVEVTTRTAVVEISQAPPPTITVTPTGIPGPKGEPGRDGGNIKVPFAWGDASPKPIFQMVSGSTLFRASLVIQVPFDGVDSLLELGDQDEGDRLIRSDQNLPSQAGEYTTSPGFTYLAATLILLRITPGEGNSQGSGFVLLEI